jgi:hypothetical protein
MTPVLSKAPSVKGLAVYRLPLITPPFSQIIGLGSVYETRSDSYFLMPPSILLVEDNLHDLELGLFALEKCDLPHEVVSVKGGEEALD